MKKLVFAFTLLFMGINYQVMAQSFLKTEYTPVSHFKNDMGDNLGSGDLLKFSGRYTLPLSVKPAKQGRHPVVWAATLSGSYALLNNRNMMEHSNPTEILNLGGSLTYRRPVSERWSLVAMLGAGIYASPNAISAKSVLVNAGTVFIYRVRDNLDLGVGAGLTNSFGIPIIMPMALISWRLSGKYEVNVDIANNFEVSAATRFSNKFKLKLVGIEMSGMSSVIDIDGKSMIYSSTAISSYLAPEWKIGKTSVVYIGAGGTWIRSVTLTKRTLKDFFNNMFSDDKPDLHFNATGYVVAGFRFGF